MFILTFLIILLPFLLAYGTEDPRLQNISQVQLEADILELSQTQQSVCAKGNAMVRQGNTKIQANQLIAFYKGGADKNSIDIPLVAQNTLSDPPLLKKQTQKIQRIEAQGNVYIQNNQQHAFAEKAVYECALETFILTGHNLKLIVNPKTVVTAEESLEYLQKQNIGIAKGNATVFLEKGRKLTAPRLLAYFVHNTEKKLTLSKIVADDGVKIESPTEIITSAEGIFNVQENIIFLTGNVSIQRGKNKITGDRAEVNLRTGISRLLGKKNQRVHAQITPEPHQTTVKGGH